MKKIVRMVILFIILSTVTLTLSGCHTNKSYTYNVETGDTIEVSMDTTNGYDITPNLPIKFSKGDEVISQGSFGQENAYDMYHQVVEMGTDANLIEEKSKDNIEYFFYEYDNKEYNYIIKIKNSKTCFILANSVSKESAEEIFEKLKFNVE